MSLFIASLNSGSNGNCYYIGDQESAVLIDAGISCREIERRMKQLELPIDRVRAVFISHEHSDHINGISTLSKRYRLPVYITPKTEISGRLNLDERLVRRFNTKESIDLGAIRVTAFQKSHDAGDPHSFLVSSNGVHIGVFTDIGMACDRVIHYFRQCHAAFLEANYDEGMLMNGNYPVHLKKRISHDQGHLSNRQALELFLSHRPTFMSHLVLAHLSENNNDPTLVADLFRPHAGQIAVTVASRYEASPVIEIDPVTRTAQPVYYIPPPARKAKPEQLSLF